MCLKVPEISWSIDINFISRLSYINVEKKKTKEIIFVEKE